MAAEASLVQGRVASGFEHVRDVFAENFRAREELGAAFAATLDGELVVDLWGGLADETSGRPWLLDTSVVIFSGTKGLVALCLLMLVDRGELDLEAPVFDYWPQFAAEGKRDVRVADIVSHRARLPGLHEAVSEDDVIDDRRMAELLAAQPRETDPRAILVYHPFTYGWLCGELVRRVDGRSVGRFFAEEVAGPLGLRLWIGLPDGLEHDVATLQYASSWGQGPLWDPGAAAGDELLARVWHNPPILRGDSMPWNRRDWLGAEIPGAGGVGTARSLARLYGCLARGGELDGVRLLSESTLARGRRELSRGHDVLLDEPMVWGVGFALQGERQRLGPPADAFGHGGAGGSIHGAWPSLAVGFSYTMNRMRDDEDVDPRAAALLDALHTSTANLH